MMMRAPLLALAFASADAARAAIDVEQDLGLAMQLSHWQKEVDEAAQRNNTTLTNIKVATLNALAKEKCSPSLASFPTVTQETIRKKNDGWLTGVLDVAFNNGVDFFAVQESDNAEVAASKYQKAGACVTWVDPPPGTGDVQHLCWNPATIERSSNSPDWENGLQLGGITVCNFTLVADPRRSITVMAAHATPSFAEALKLHPTILAAKPDIILMDANQRGSQAKSAFGGDYGIFPPHDSEVTTIKSSFKYRKLYQAFEGTCEVSRQCTAHEQGFANLPDELRTCRLLLKSGKCGNMSSKISENMWLDNPDVCKYASRLCGEYEKDYKDQMDSFLATHPSVPSRSDFDLKHIRALLWGDGPKVEDTVTKKAQEDVVIFKKGLKLFGGAVIPGTQNAAFMAEGEKNGYPNQLWPSDHFLVAAALEI